MSDDRIDGIEAVYRPSPVDVHVGSRIRLGRTMMGLSQERLGEALGLTFQQVQKYERGTNRVGASRLWDLSKILGVDVGFFFGEMPRGITSERLPANSPYAMASAPTGGVAEPAAGFESKDESVHQRETLELVRTYHRITDPVMRRRVFDLIKTMAPREG